MIEHALITTPNYPPGPQRWAPFLATRFLFSRQHVFATCSRRYGNVFTLAVPTLGRVVVVGDPALAKEVFMAPVADVGVFRPNLGESGFGPGSVFSLDEPRHHQHRRLLAPPFHGRSVKNYASLVEEETLAEAQSWPTDRVFAIYPGLARITLATIMRAVFGLPGPLLDELREVVPAFISLGSRLSVLRPPRRLRWLLNQPFAPWGRLRSLRRRYDAILDELMRDAKMDGNFEDRTDVLALLMRSRYEDGSPMSRDEIADELLSLVGAGYETTAATLGWIMERIVRHPRVLDRLSAEALTDDNVYRLATITEVQRVRSVVDFTPRRIKATQFRLGPWALPKGTPIIVAISQLHANSQAFPDPDRFMPERFVDQRPPSGWAPFGGGTRRCVGAAFATAQIDVVLRTMLRQFEVLPSHTPDEGIYLRGISNSPRARARVQLRRRA